MQNEDAAYKLIAYRIANELHPDKDKPKPETHFQYFYEKQLQRDIMEPAREIIEDDYLPKPKSKPSNPQILLFLYFSKF